MSENNGKLDKLLCDSSKAAELEVDTPSGIAPGKTVFFGTWENSAV